MAGLILKQVGKYFTRPANLHFFLPISLCTSLTHSSVYKPAQISGLKFPGRTLFLLLWGTVLYYPARFAAFTISIHSGNKKVHLPLHIGWNGSPCLLVAVDSLYRGSEQLCHLFLGFVETFSEMNKLVAVHGKLRESDL
jgi:hypothetical protein